jgi:hypothetical protein
MEINLIYACINFFYLVGSLERLEGGEYGCKKLAQTNIKLNRGIAALGARHCCTAALPHLQERLGHSSKSIQRNLD